MMKIILATKSPYRQEAFKFLGINFEVKASNIDEYINFFVCLCANSS